jgi:hypothetical protein
VNGEVRKNKWVDAGEVQTEWWSDGVLEWCLRRGSLQKLANMGKRPRNPEIQNVVSEGNVKKILVQIGANYREMVRIGARRFDSWGKKNVGLIRFK